MSQTKDGAIKLAAKLTGLSVDDYKRKKEEGWKYCNRCKEWKPIYEFSQDSTRTDGRNPKCRVCSGFMRRGRYLRKTGPIRHGPIPESPRDGDVKQARQRINVEVRTGRRPHPNTLSCVDCGHVWRKGERRHEYDHYLGYEAIHHFDVVPVCTICHRRRSKFIQYRDKDGCYSSVKEESGHGRNQ